MLKILKVKIKKILPQFTKLLLLSVHSPALLSPPDSLYLHLPGPGPEARAAGSGAGGPGGPGGPDTGLGPDDELQDQEVEIIPADYYGRSDGDQWSWTRYWCGEVSCQKLMFNLNEQLISKLAFQSQTYGLSAGVAGNDERRQEGREERTPQTSRDIIIDK